MHYAQLIFIYYLIIIWIGLLLTPLFFTFYNVSPNRRDLWISIGNKI